MNNYPGSIILTQCVSKKQQTPAPARELYTSRLFQAQRRYAEAVGDNWYILSAEHGLVTPDTELAPYDTHISDVDAEMWADTVVSELCPVSQPVRITAGAKYADPLVPELEARGVEVVEPFRGEGIGTRIQSMIAASRKAENTQLQK
jgi:hypothetical protein